MTLFKFHSFCSWLQPKFLKESSKKKNKSNYCQFIQLRCRPDLVMSSFEVRTLILTHNFFTISPCNMSASESQSPPWTNMLSTGQVLHIAVLITCAGYNVCGNMEYIHILEFHKLISEICYGHIPLFDRLYGW